MNIRTWLVYPLSLAAVVFATSVLGGDETAPTKAKAGNASGRNSPENSIRPERKDVGNATPKEKARLRPDTEIDPSSKEKPGDPPWMRGQHPQR